MDADFIYVNIDGSRSMETEQIAQIPNVGDGKLNRDGRGYKIVAAVSGIIGTTIVAVEVA